MERKTISVNIFFFLILLLLSVVQVVMLNKFSTFGGQLSVINEQIGEQEGENSLYSEKIASASSIASISQKSEKLGLDITPTLLSLEQAPPVAFSLQLNL